MKRVDLIGFRRGMNAFYVSSEDKSKIRIKEPLGINPFKQNQKPGSLLTLILRESPCARLFEFLVDTDAH